MQDPAAGLHEKLVWFWHGHFTSSIDKVGSWQMMWNQHGLLRQQRARQLPHDGPRR